MAEYIVQGESLTPIADNIRSIQGKTETMFLSDMKTGLDTIKKDIDDAFTTIGNKGGTVPSSKTSGNLSSAIESISGSGGVVVERKTGVLNLKGGVTESVLCDFKPDAIFFTINEDTNGYKIQTGVSFVENGSDNCLCVLGRDYANSLQFSSSFTVASTRTETGFTVIPTGSASTNISINYAAIKYT